LPVWSGAQPPVLWEDPNPWREAFAQRERGEGLVPFIVPLGDVEDLNAISAERALNADPAALAAIAERYQAEEVLITQAMPEGERVSVVTRRFRCNPGQHRPGACAGLECRRGRGNDAHRSSLEGAEPYRRRGR